MNKLIAILAILGAIALMLYQVVDMEQVAKEYKPVMEAFDKAVEMIPAKEEVIETVDDKITTIKANPKVVKYKADRSTLIIDPDSPEIANSNYSWLKNKVDRMSYPNIKKDLREALTNDGVIRQNEYNTIINRTVDYNESQDAGAKAELKESLNE